MRVLGLVVAAVVLAGCTGSFPEGSRVVAELQVGNLAAGDRAVENFSLAAPADFVAVGYRTGPGGHVHLALRAPDGTLYDTSTEAGMPCVVKPALAGAWALEAWADPFDGALQGGKFTIRTGRGEPPPLYACANDAFPAAGRNVTLGTLDLQLTANATGSATFEQPWDLAALTTRARGDVANATILVAPPGGTYVAPANVTAPVAKGTWRLRVVAADAPIANATLAIEGVGS